MVLLESTDLPLGKFQAPDFQLKGIDDKKYSLSDFSSKKGLVIIFTCNHCPYAKAAWPLVIDLSDIYKSKNIAFVAINPNDPVSYPDDSFENMKIFADKTGVNFPYLFDGTQQVARDYKAQCTPDVYVFDKNRKLYYHGRINDNWQFPEKVTANELQDALEMLLADSPPPENQQPSMGCSIKWSSS